MALARIRFSTRARGAVAALVLTTTPAAMPAAAMPAAQSVIISGTVSSQGQPVGGATVGIAELGVDARTSVDGRYSFVANTATIAGREVSMVARAIGYRPNQVRITLSAGRVERDFILDKDVLNLDQVVVTGVGGATSTRKTPFAVGVVDAAQIRDAPSSSPLGVLAGRVAGVSVLTVSGTPGAAPAIRLRSTGTLIGSADPLIIIDGTISRLTLADINGEDVERMEVLKGAAASSLYGSDAANGVVQIFTKRGLHLAEGQTMFTLRTEYGRSWLPEKRPGSRAHGYQLLPDGDFRLSANGARVPEADQIADNPYAVYYDQLNQIFRPGTFMTNYVSVGQRRGNTNFNVSFHNSKESGVFGLLDGFSRQNFRLNLDQQLTSDIGFSAGAFYGRSHSDEGADEGVLFGLRYLEPNVDLLAPNSDGSPFNAAILQRPQLPTVENPLYRMANSPVTRDRDRFNGTFKLTYKPFLWLTAEGNANYEQSSGTYKSFTPRGFLNSGGAGGNGRLVQIATAARASNLGATLTAVRTTRWFTNTTKLAYVFEDQSSSDLNVASAQLTLPRVPEFAAADPGALIDADSRSETIRNQNLFAITTFDINERYIVDALVRQDASSLFGRAERRATYNRFSGAWRISEDFPLPGVDELKLRASYGTAGLRPIFEAQYEIFTLIGGLPAPVTLGNRRLKPAFSRESEIGFNLNFLRNYTVEYSYSDKRTSDQILRVPLSATTGYANTWGNAGTLGGHTHELALGALLLSSGDRFWRVNLTADRTRQRIADLQVPPFLAGPDRGTSLSLFRVAAGEPLGVIYGSRWIRTAQQLATSLSSGMLAGTEADYRLNEEGYYVSTVAFGTVDEKPLRAFAADGTTEVQIGDVNPDYNLALSSTFQGKRFSIAALVTVVKGGDIYNYTRQATFNEERDPIYDQRGKPEPERKPIPYYQTYFNSGSASEFFVEDGSYVRLRELSINWQLPTSWVNAIGVMPFETARLGIVGRNLWTSTRYGGYDPDVTAASGNPFTYRVDYFSYPAYRTFTLMLELGF